MPYTWNLAESVGGGIVAQVSPGVRDGAAASGAVEAQRSRRSPTTGQRGRAGAYAIWVLA